MPVIFPDGEVVQPSEHVASVLVNSLVQASLKSDSAVPKALRAIVLQQTGVARLGSSLSSTGGLCFDPVAESVRPALLAPPPADARDDTEVSGDIDDLRSRWVDEISGTLLASRKRPSKPKTIERVAAEKAGIYDLDESSSSSDDYSGFSPYFLRGSLKRTLGGRKHTIDELQDIASMKTRKHMPEYYRIIDSLFSMGSSPYFYGIGNYGPFLEDYCKSKGIAWIGSLSRRRGAEEKVALSAAAPAAYNDLSDYCDCTERAPSVMCSYAMGRSVHDNCQCLLELLCGDALRKVQTFYPAVEAVCKRDKPLVAIAKFLESHTKARELVRAFRASNASRRAKKPNARSEAQARVQTRGAILKEEPVADEADTISDQSSQDGLSQSLSRLIPAAGPMAPYHVYVVFNCGQDIKNLSPWINMLKVLKMTGCVSFIFTQNVVATPKFLTTSFLSKFKVEFIQFSTFTFTGLRIPTLDAKLGALRAVRDYRLARRMEEERRARIAAGEYIDETRILESFRAIIRHMATGGLQRQVLTHLLEWQAAKMAANGASGNQNRMATHLDGVNVEAFEADMRDLTKHKKLLLPFYTSLEEFLRDFFSPEAVLGNARSRESQRLIETALAAKGQTVVYVPCLYTELLSLIDLLNE